MKNIVLIGLMGSGKTEVGKKLAERLKYTFIDTDSLVEKKKGKSVAAIFIEDGEPYFRELEAEIVRELSVNSRHVISTGGGIVIGRENMSNLKHGGLLVWLKASPETIYSRIKAETHRPLLEVENQLEEIKMLSEMREQLYADADISIDTDELDVDKIVDVIIDAYRSRRL